MSGTIADLRDALTDGLHVDNLDRMLQLCGTLLATEGDSRLPLFVLAACLGRLRSLKQEVPVRASVVERPDQEFADALGRVLDAVASGEGRDKLWELTDELVGKTLSLPPEYPSG